MHETAANMREKLFTMRMSEEESLRLETVARHYGLNAAGVIRMLVKREHDSIVGLPRSEERKTLRQAMRAAEVPIEELQSEMKRLGRLPKKKPKK